MKTPSRLIHRFSALLLAVMCSLQLSGCSWYFMPGPVIITDEIPTETVSSKADAPSGETSLPETVPPSGAVSTEEERPSSQGETEPSAGTTSKASESAPSETASAAPTIPTSETGGSQSEVSFAIDYYRTPAALHKAASDAILVDAYNVINCCLAFKTSVQVSCSKEETGLVLYLADTLCPLVKAFTNVSEDSWSDGVISWKFYVDKVEFSIIRAEFEQQVKAYIEPVMKEEYSETERALLLYHAYTAPASYNFEILSGAFKTYTEAEQHRIHSAYAGIMNHTGVCHDLAGGMTFLFIQAGFNACRVSVINKDDEHSWTLIELDRRFTFCDATWDVGGSFAYFGNSVNERTTAVGGSFKKEQMMIYDLNVPAHFTVVNPGFKKVQSLCLTSVGTLVDLSINTKASPHTLRFTNTNTRRSVSIPCP